MESGASAPTSSGNQPQCAVKDGLVFLRGYVSASDLFDGRFAMLPSACRPAVLTQTTVAVSVTGPSTLVDHETLQLVLRSDQQASYVYGIPDGASSNVKMSSGEIHLAGVVYSTGA